MTIATSTIQQLCLVSIVRYAWFCGRSVVAEELHIGRHSVRFDERDVLILRVRGEFLPGEMGEIARVHDTRLIQEGRLFVLCDVREGLPPSAAARKELQSRPKKLPPHWIAYVGIPKEFAIPLDLIVRAVSLLSSSKIVHRYFQDEPTARRWIEEMRTKASA